MLSELLFDFIRALALLYQGSSRLLRFQGFCVIRALTLSGLLLYVMSRALALLELWLYQGSCVIVALV